MRTPFERKNFSEINCLHFMVFSDSPVCTVLVTITAVNFLGGVVPAGTGCQEVIWQITLEKQVLLPHCIHGLNLIIFFFELQ